MPIGQRWLIFPVGIGFQSFGVALREGTLISALVTGSIARCLIKRLSRVDAHGNRTIYLHV